MTNIFALLFFVLTQLTVEQQLAEKYCPSKTNFKQPCPTGQCEVLGKSTSLLGFQPPTPLNSLQDSRSLKSFQRKAFRHFVKMSDRELPTHQSIDSRTAIGREILSLKD